MEKIIIIKAFVEKINNKLSNYKEKIYKSENLFNTVILFFYLLFNYIKLYTKYLKYFLIFHYYNKLYFSQQAEDFIINRNFINQKNNDGFFVEIGAYTGLHYSNTKYLEDNLNFKGMLVEPIKKNFEKLIINREKNNILINKAISKDKQVVMFGEDPMAGILNTMHKSTYNHHIKHNINNKTIIKAITVEQLFKEYNITYIDFLSIDVEGGELDVLETINWKNISIYLICIELDNENIEKDEKCRKILKENGFEFKLKMNINEFWLNPLYFRKNKLFKKNKKKFTGNILDYGYHLFIEKSIINELNNSIINYENLCKI